MDSSSIFLSLLDVPGLQHLVEENLLLYLPNESLLNLELVCKSWRNFLISRQIWRKRIDHVRQTDEFIEAFCEQKLEDYHKFDNFDLTVSHRTNKVLGLLIHWHLPSRWHHGDSESLHLAYHPNHCLESMLLSSRHLVLVSHKIAVYRNSYGEFGENGIPLPVKPSAFRVMGDILLLGDREGHLTFHDLDSDVVVFQILQAHNSSVESVALCGEFAFSTAMNDGVKVWKITTMTKDGKLFSVDLHQTLDCHTFGIVPLDSFGEFLIAGEGTANHIWKLTDDPTAAYKFFCYLNPRNGENIRHVACLRHKPGFFVSIDYSGTVFVWNIREKKSVQSISTCSSDTTVVENPYFLGVCTCDRVSLFDTSSSDGDLTLVRHIDLTTLIDCDKVSTHSYRLIYAAATCSKLLLCYNDDVVIIDVLAKRDATSRRRNSRRCDDEFVVEETKKGSPGRSGVISQLFSAKKKKELFVPRNRREKQVLYWGRARSEKPPANYRF